MRMTIETGLEGKTVTPDEGYVRKREEGFFSFVRVGRFVFKHPESFATEAEAQAFVDLSLKEGVTIDA